MYFLETGLLLLVVPWSVFWERNLFVDRVPVIREAFLNHFVRGAISGIGLVCLAAAVAELMVLWKRRPSAQHDSTGTPAPDADLPG